MTPFTRLQGRAAPLMRANIDTDAIIPSREMRSVGKTGLGVSLFANWRYAEHREAHRDEHREAHREAHREERPDFVLNQAPFRNATILLAGENFGCGSSREGAVWALTDYGIRAIVAPSFGSIFRANCIRNGLLPVVLPASIVDRLAAQMEAAAGEIAIDLTACTVTDALGQCYPFALPPLQRDMLLAGLDSIGLALRRATEIDAFHDTLKGKQPWLFSGF